jgi:hypothetical protein
MRAMVFDRYVKSDVMSLKEVPVPDPQDSVTLYIGAKNCSSKGGSLYSSQLLIHELNGDIRLTVWG